MVKTIALIGTFDSKAEEYLFAKRLIEDAGLNTFTVHTGVFESPFKPDIDNIELSDAVGGDIREIANRKDRASGTELMSKAIAQELPKYYEQGKFDGVLAFGGSGGTALATAGMQKLPIGVPKIMVSTVAGNKNVEAYVGVSDIIMVPSIVDVSGLNTISKRVFSNATFALIGMVQHLDVEHSEDKKPLIAATMFGVTTPAVNKARELLTEKGYEVLVFHATGNGGKVMENLISSNFFSGVLDLTTTEWNDELFGGILTAGNKRLDAAASSNIPQVVSVGALDMVNFGAIDLVPTEYKDRNLYKHNPSTTLMRTTKEENVLVGKKISEKLNKVTRKTYLLLPLKGVSSLDAKGFEFYDPEADKALFETLHQSINNPLVEIIEINANINDDEFATTASKKLIELINE